MIEINVNGASIPSTTLSGSIRLTCTYIVLVQLREFYRKKCRYDYGEIRVLMSRKSNSRSIAFSCSFPIGRPQNCIQFGLACFAGGAAMRGSLTCMPAAATASVMADGGGYTAQKAKWGMTVSEKKNYILQLHPQDYLQGAPWRPAPLPAALARDVDVDLDGLALLEREVQLLPRRLGLLLQLGLHPERFEVVLRRQCNAANYMVFF